MKHRERQPDAFEAALLEERPEIPPDFAAKLDAWAAEGFPPAEGAGSGSSAWERLRKRLSVVGPSGVLAPAGMVAVALVALVVGINALSDTGGQTGTDSLSGSPDPDSLEPDVRALLTKVATGELDAGIVYATDISGAVEVIAIPAANAVLAVYPIAVLAASPREDLAAAFVDFVLSPRGQALLAANGFEAP